MACLCVGRSIHEVKDEKLKKYYLDTLNEIPLNNIKLVVPIICWECEATLHKVLAFREQVKDSYRILQTFTENLNECLLTDVSRSPRLKIHTNVPITILPNDLEDIKLENADTDKTEKLTDYKTDIVPSDDEPNEDIQTVMCDVKRYKRKKKNLHKIRKVSRLDEKDPVDITEDERSLIDIKIEENKDIYNQTLTKDDVTDSTKNISENVRNHTKNGDMKVYNENTLLQIEMDVVKLELDDRDDDSDSDTKDIDTEIQSFLDNVKKNSEKGKSRSKKKCDDKCTKNNIITVDLSYEEMQAERLKLSQTESFLQAQYKCESCYIVFNSPTSQKAHHTKKHAVKGDFICSICKTIISSVEAFTLHYKSHMRRYECPTCGKRATNIKTIQQHVYAKHEKNMKKYQCNVCGKVSNSLDTHRYHRDTHKARVECSQCDKTFSHRAGLMNHRLAVHESQNEFPCTVCDKVFRWKTSLKRHLEKHENENKGSTTQNRAFCASCGIGFSSVCSFQRHLRNSLKHVTHDQLKFICDHCKQRFADKTKLRDHIEEKHLHRTFQCPICNKPSKNRVGLEQHIRAVHKGRPNNRMCHHCGKGFPTKVQLESHIRTHTGERPFMCEFCPTTFSQQSNLYKHHRQVHLNIKSKRYLCKKRRLDGNESGDVPFTLPIMQYLPENGFSL
ncbi:unnamed protein product, partial [Brenthis ino]